MDLHETVMLIIVMTLSPLLFLVPKLVHEFLEWKREDMLQLLAKLKPYYDPFSQVH